MIAIAEALLKTLIKLPCRTVNPLTWVAVLISKKLISLNRLKTTSKKSAVIGIINGTRCLDENLPVEDKNLFILP